MDLSTIAFILPNKLAASCAGFVNGEVAAVDGVNPVVYIFDTDGILVDEIATVRAYKTFHVENNTGRILALSGCSAQQVYILDSTFAETGSVFLTLDLTTEDTHNLNDASPDIDEDGNFNIIGTHRHSVRAYSAGGLQLGFVRRPDSGIYAESFVYSGDASLFHYSLDNLDFVELTIPNGEVITGMSPRCIVLRTISVGNADCASCFYGLFGYQYIHNYFIPLYDGESFVMPTQETIKNIMIEKGGFSG